MCKIATKTFGLKKKIVFSVLSFIKNLVDFAAKSANDAHLPKVHGLPLHSVKV